MRKVCLLFGLIVMMFVAMPMSAQSRKDKKAAKKAEWEMKQQQKAEEAALLHKMKMDSIRDAQAARDAAKEAAAKEAAAKEAAAAREAAIKEMGTLTIIEMPCEDAAISDKNYYREIGIGTSSGGNLDAALMNALVNAKDKIKARLGEFIQGFTNSYYGSYTGSKEMSDVARRSENIFNGVVEKMLNDADPICRKRALNGKGITEMYIAIEISKHDFKEAMADQLSKDEKLSINFDRSNFQNYMDERLDGIKEAKKNAGY